LIQNTKKGAGEWVLRILGYVKQTMAGFLGLLMAQSAASAESKFLSLHSFAMRAGLLLDLRQRGHDG
jgi:hypothetical protein